MAKGDDDSQALNQTNIHERLVNVTQKINLTKICILLYTGVI